VTDDTPLCNWTRFDQEIAQSQQALPRFREQIKATREILKERFLAGLPTEHLVHANAEFIDGLLQRAWQSHVDPQAKGIALIAVGGYGRGELHPASDIDILILFQDEAAIEACSRRIEQFLMFLWDMGLEVGHSVRTLEECVSQATDDITIATNCMEARLLAGPEALFQAMKAAVGPDNIWPSPDFYRAKLDEQIARHHRFHDTGYNLEPNIKESPGGLRDLQVIGWVAKRHFGTDSLHGLVEHAFLTENEYHSLIEAQNFLWKIRFGLHVLTGRREDRLLFDHQRTLAEEFGYEDKDSRLAVELFMKDYYRTVLELSRLNEMLLQLFEEVIVLKGNATETVPINEHFQMRNGFFEAVHDDVFKREPSALLEIFLLIAQHPEARGVRAGTIRLIREHHYLIDDEFRRSPRCHELFLTLFQQGTGLTHELRRMNRYGVLAAYLPMFAHCVGLMQHDLFHVYTVDEHTMFVVRNLRRLTVPEFAHEFPLCSQIIAGINNQEVLTLAGFFHDIGKGLGGDHSVIGATDAMHFCQEHGVNEQDTKMIMWLVKNHLLMSMTAQRKDISDPEIIAEFAAQVGSQYRLDSLYLLTVADIRATSPDVWNSWKDALLRELYLSTSRMLRRGLNNPIDEADLVEETQSLALKKLSALGFRGDQIQAHWNQLGDEYFLRHSADEVIWHTQHILERGGNDEPLVLTRSETHRGGTEVFVYTRDHEYLFALITSTLEQLGLNINDARIITSSNHYTFDTFLVLEDDGEPIHNEARLHEIHAALTKRLKNPQQAQQAVMHMPRQLKHFPIETEVLFNEDAQNNRTMMEVIAGDRPGLLARIASALESCGVILQTAKIATFGERAEDIFFVTEKIGDPLSVETQEALREAITKALE
jgi:[protein-PII] uridylyltransferase